MIICSICQKPLTGGLDTYGEINLPVCLDCFWFKGDEGDHFGFMIRCGTCRSATSATLRNKPIDSNLNRA